jgi:hypothetical protein
MPAAVFAFSGTNPDGPPLAPTSGMLASLRTAAVVGIEAV